MQLVELGHLSSVVSKGTTPTTLGHAFAVSGVPFLRAEDLTNGEVRANKAEYFIPTETHDLLSRSQLEPGDLLITIAGTLGRVAYIPKDAPPMNCNQAVAFARLNSSLADIKYLYLICQSPDLIKTLVDLKKVGTIGNLNLEQVRELKIPLPSLPEQKRIAAILDKADRLHRQRRFAQTLSDSFLQSVFIKMFGEPIANPMNWEKCRIDDVTVSLDFRRIPVESSIRGKLKKVFPYYGASGIIDRVDDFIFDETTLLVAEDGANLLARSTPIAFIARGKYWVNNHAHVLAMNGKSNFEYVCYILNQTDLEPFVTGSAQPKLTADKLSSIKVILPPLPLQEKFAAIVQKFERIRRQQREATRQAEHLFQTLLHRAFRGEL